MRKGRECAVDKGSRSESTTKLRKESVMEATHMTENWSVMLKFKLFLFYPIDT